MAIDYIKTIQWTKRWAGSYTFISCSNYGWQYYHEMKKAYGTYFQSTIHIHKKGIVSCYMPKDELQRIGNTISEKLIENPDLTEHYLNNVISLTDKLLPLMQTNFNNIPNWNEYKIFFICQETPYVGGSHVMILAESQYGDEWHHLLTKHVSAWQVFLMRIRPHESPLPKKPRD